MTKLEPNDQPEEDLTSRSDKKRARKVRETELARLAKDLASLTAKRLEALELPESIVDSVVQARALKSPRAVERQLRVVRAALRDADWPEIHAKLAELREHGIAKPRAAPSASESQARAWLVRLLGEGELAIDDLLAQHPSADRKHLRMLVRNAQTRAPERRQRAEHKLASTLRFLLENA